MRASRKTVFFSGALAVAAALLSVVAAIPSQATTDSSAVVTPAVSQDQLRAALPDASSYPEGTTLSVRTVSDAKRDGRFAVPPGVTVSPSVCVDLLTVVSGSIDRISGWIQQGNLTNGTSSATVAGVLTGGGNLKAVQDTVANCKSVNVTLPGDVRGTLTLTATAGPDIAGAQTLSVKEVASFPTNPSLNVTNYQVYASAGDVLVLTCDPDEPTAEEFVESVIRAIFGVA